MSIAEALLTLWFVSVGFEVLPDGYDTMDPACLRTSAGYSIWTMSAHIPDRTVPPDADALWRDFRSFVLALPLDEHLQPYELELFRDTRGIIVFASVAA